MVRSINTEKLDVVALQKGMFVSRLDIPWSQTKYPIRGFLIQHSQQIEELAEICCSVYVDRVLSIGAHSIKPHALLKPKFGETKTKTVRRNIAGLSSKKIAARRNSFGTEKYPIVSSLKKEIKIVNNILDDSMVEISSILDNRRAITAADISSIKHFTSQMVSSAIRNPDALTWLCKIKNVDFKTYNGLISSAVTGILFARHIGLTKDKIEILAQALMLRGIGLIKLDKRHLIAYRPGDKDPEYFRHIDLTLEEISQFSNISGLVANTITNYCERFDGKGYPARKEGIRIPLLSQMMGLVAFYENSVHPWVESRAVSPAKAISNLFASVDTLFCKDLVEQFVQSTGIYPVGCFVRLSDSSTGVVIGQNKKQRLRPTVAIIKNANNVPLHNPVVVDLFEKNLTDGISITSGISNTKSYDGLVNFTPEMLQQSSNSFDWRKPKTWLDLIA